MNDYDTIVITVGTKLNFPKANMTGEVTAVKMVRAIGQWEALAVISLRMEDGSISQSPVEVALGQVADYFKSGDAEIGK